MDCYGVYDATWHIMSAEGSKRAAHHVGIYLAIDRLSIDEVIRQVLAQKPAAQIGVAKSGRRRVVVLDERGRVAETLSSFRCDDDDAWRDTFCEFPAVAPRPNPTDKETEMGRS
jgi:hypothetical protein